MSEDTSKTPSDNETPTDDQQKASPGKIRKKTDEPKEIGGRGGLDPTRYGDWEKDGRCIDF